MTDKPKPRVVGLDQEPDDGLDENGWGPGDGPGTDEEAWESYRRDNPQDFLPPAPRRR